MYEQQSLLTADLDEIIDATGHNDAQPQEQAQKAPAVKYYPIDEETARRAHEMMSMRDYPAGRATNEYRASVDKARPLCTARPGISGRRPPGCPRRSCTVRLYHHQPPRQRDR